MSCLLSLVVVFLAGPLKPLRKIELRFTQYMHLEKNLCGVSSLLESIQRYVKKSLRI